MPFILYWGHRMVWPILLLYQKTPAAGSYSTVHVATAPGLRGSGGSYFLNCQASKDVSPLAYDRAVGKRLWEVSERACAAALAGAGGLHKASNPHQ